MSDPLALELVEAIARSPVALARLRELAGEQGADRCSVPSAPAFTVHTLAAELGRTERSIRAAIARGELAAVKRGRGYVISADAVAEWATSPIARESYDRGKRAESRALSPRRRRSGAGPATRALRGAR